ncbi:hypothetical protein PAXRUDRAFT_824829 [Paxillus rubicundulus Ve08.2h10]|uniref:Unplaced genomic scaffold scaffold_109, whole genome shotgun sequence n=1 Tax=Paxillus rubicundulus Ve08.2h10 TaxID=930991 RepID=A0A0D0E7A5_9AGAM|nr:hypothetical protein PAXRUDRAFT_824829 [Paxillus rubicundulus Ve08.2h10]
MIVVADSDWKQSFQNNSPGQESGNSGPTHAAPQARGSLDPYATPYNALPPPPPPPPYYYHSYSSYTPPIPTVIAVPYRQSSTSRFWTAFAFALILYLGFVGLAHTVIDMATGGIHWDNGAVGAPSPGDGNVLRYIGGLNWTSYQSPPDWAPRYPRGAQTSFILPVHSDELYLISRGSYQHGKVKVKQSVDVEVSNVVVEVRVAYHHDRALGRATVCKLRKEESKIGVGIFTPTLGWPLFIKQDQLNFEVTFIFPVTRPGSPPILVNRFLTTTHNFVHEVGDLWQSIIFGDVDLNTSNSPIQVEALTLAKGSFTSSNSFISGHFNTSDSLILRTSNGNIDVTASLLSTRERATKLDMRTSNSFIKSEVSLSTRSDSGGNFDVKAHTSNSMIDLKYDDSPLDACLISEAQTSNSAVSVKMHPAFEGAFEVASSNMGPIVKDEKPSDPSGRRRRRILNQNKARGTISGSVYWVGSDGARRETRSYSTARTSNSHATLKL